MPDQDAPAPPEVPAGDAQGAHSVPGQPPGSGPPPVPAPGTPVGTSSPGVQAAQGASPQDGIHAGTKDEGSDSSIASPGAFVAAAVPGKPDGEVDTRST